MRNSFEFRCLVQAIEANQYEHIDHALRNNPDLIYLVDTHGVSLLHWAAVRGRVEIVTCLLQADAPVDAANFYGVTPLLKAVGSGHLEVVKLLVEFGASIHVTTRYGDGALHTAVSMQRNDVLQYLLMLGAAVNHVNHESLSVLHMAVRHGNQAAVELLVRHGAAVNQLDGNGWAPLHYAARSGSAQLLRVLLQLGAEIDQCTISGETALHFAVASGHLDAVVVLLEAGANATVTCLQGRDALYYAVVDSDCRVANRLAQEYSVAQLEQFLLINHPLRQEEEAALGLALIEGLVSCRQAQALFDNTLRNNLTLICALRAANVGFFAASKLPESTTGLPFDLQLRIARHQLEVDPRAAQRFVNYVEASRASR